MDNSYYWFAIPAITVLFIALGVMEYHLETKEVTYGTQMAKETK